MINKLLKLQSTAIEEIKNTQTIHDLNEVKALDLGKKSPLFFRRHSRRLRRRAAPRAARFVCQVASYSYRHLKSVVR